MDICIDDIQVKYKPPFPWFGGKSKVAKIVWQYLGDVSNYAEPFFGSGAVMFARPTPPKVETVNDKDHMIANFWRAVKNDPAKVADYADNPVNEDDLTARHIWLVKYGIPELDRRIMADPEFYDPKIAGWWVWGICCWIGGGWCSGKGPWTEEDGQLVHLGAGRGVNRQRVHLGNAGLGVNRKRVHLGNAGLGVNRKRVHLGASRGVNRQLVELIEYMQSLADRLQNTRVCSGDWARIVTNGALAHGSTIGVFLDPPYSAETKRDMTLYREESEDVAHEVREWCKENGGRKNYRIVLCGYDGEHNELETLGWGKHLWKAGACYQTTTSKNENRKREALWFSPHCLSDQQVFFDKAGALTQFGRMYSGE